MSLSMRLDVSGLDKILVEIQEELDDAARPAAQAGAQVLYEAVIQNVQSLGRVTGNLASSIYQAYSRDNSWKGRATYHVSWNAQKAPHGHLIENGHWQYFVTYRNASGETRTVIRPSMRGKPPPSSRASIAEKSRYFVPLQQPRWVPAKPFIRPAQAQFGAAQEAAEKALLDRLQERGIVR